MSVSWQVDNYFINTHKNWRRNFEVSWYQMHWIFLFLNKFKFHLQEMRDLFTFPIIISRHCYTLKYLLRHDFCYWKFQKVFKHWKWEKLIFTLMLKKFSQIILRICKFKFQCKLVDQILKYKLKFIHQIDIC